MWRIGPPGRGAARGRRAAVSARTIDGGRARHVPTAIGRGLLGGAAIAFGYLAYLYLALPDVRPLLRLNPASTAFIELRTREARAAGHEPRRVQHWIAYRRISPNLTKAVLVAEDAAFWKHEGVDYDELQKSIEADWSRGQLFRGASTITQQLAKNLYLSPSRNPLRKLRELVIARRLEATLTKTRILELYLNVIEWGNGIYGAEAAARTYFGIPASDLSQTQAALLAGSIINPRLLDPARPTARLLRRQQIIFRRMGATEAPIEQSAARTTNRGLPADIASDEPATTSDAPHDEDEASSDEPK